MYNIGQQRGEKIIMKDYSFGDKDYQQNFILRSELSKDYKSIIVYYANGEVRSFPNHYYTLELIEKKKREQIERAYSILHEITTEDNENLTRTIQRYIAIKLKAKDIEKNKIFLDNLEAINETLRINHEIVLHFHMFLQNRFIWGLDYPGEPYGAVTSLCLDDADKFTLKEVKEIVHYMGTTEKKYCKSHIN